MHLPAALVLLHPLVRLKVLLLHIPQLLARAIPLRASLQVIQHLCQVAQLLQEKLQLQAHMVLRTTLPIMHISKQTNTP